LLIKRIGGQLNKRITVLSTIRMTTTSPKEQTYNGCFFGLVFICSILVSRAIHSKFFLPCKFCAVLLRFAYQAFASLAVALHTVNY